MRGSQAQAKPGWELVQKQIEQLAEEMENEEYFAFLENFIDRAREILARISDPKIRADLKASYEQVINYALDLKLSQLSREQTRAGLG